MRLPLPISIKSDVLVEELEDSVAAFEVIFLRLRRTTPTVCQ